MTLKSTTSPELREARADAQKSADDFEKSLDDLKEKVAGISQSIEETIESAKRQVKNAESFVGSQFKSAEDLLGKSLDQAESQIKSKFVDLRASAEEGLRLVEEKPLAAWFTVFLSGCFLGALLARSSKAQFKNASRTL